MKFKIVVMTFLLISAYSNANFDHKLSIELQAECDSSQNISKQCEILSLKNYSVEEKAGAMGYLYLFGYQGIKPDYEKAFYWLNKSAETNNPEALNALGIMYGFGLGRPKDFKKAEKYFILANQYGEKIEAKVNLGELYRLSPEYGIPLDFEKSKKWYLLGQTENPSRAYDGLSKLYLTQEKYKDAYQYAEKSAALNNPEAQYNLGVFYRDGLYVSKNLGKAKYWFEKAAAQGHLAAKNNLKTLNK